MCGFAGFYGDFDDGEGATAILRKMGSDLAHRGPDSGGVEWLPEASLGLAHCRLSIIDLSEHGDQPMQSECRLWIVVFNGEIYNFRELRKELDRQSAANVCQAIL